MHSHPVHARFDPPSSAIDPVRAIGVNLGHMLRMTRALIAGGRRVDIAGLERQVGLLCARSLDLPPDDGRELRPMLIGLLTDLDALYTTLVQQGD